MPLYEYECTTCHRRLEKIQKFSDAELTVCPHCTGALERTITAPSFQFAGGGWYKDGYGSVKPAANGASGASVPASSDGASPAPASAPAASASETSAAAPAAVDSSASPAKPAESKPAAAGPTPAAAPSAPSTPTKS